MFEITVPWGFTIVGDSPRCIRKNFKVPAFPVFQKGGFDTIRGGYRRLLEIAGGRLCLSLCVGWLAIVGGAFEVQAEGTNQPVLQEATAPMRCAVRSDLVSWLSRSYEEESLGEGVTRQGFVMEFFVSKEGRTWTLFVTRPDGISCLVSTGSAWEGELPSISSTAGDGA